MKFSFPIIYFQIKFSYVNDDVNLIETFSALIFYIHAVTSNLYYDRINERMNECEVTCEDTKVLCVKLKSPYHDRQ